ncbi:response regulator [Magnetococcus sp. PR-3]|uniref:response regulator n=1 Tax=Magnetococcus sp. PR-3 TaxID=3120355 RepID=UPI002FCDEC4E
MHHQGDRDPISNHTQDTTCLAPSPAQLKSSTYHATRRVLTLVTLFTLLVALGLGIMLGALPLLNFYQGHVEQWWHALFNHLWLLLPALFLMVALSFWLLKGVVRPLLLAYDGRIQNLEQQLHSQQRQTGTDQAALAQAKKHSDQMVQMLKFLHRISEETQTSTDQKIRQGLDYGQALFGMEAAFISQVRDNVCRITYAMGREEMLQNGSRLPVDKNCCLHQLKPDSEGTIPPLINQACHHMVCAQRFGFETLISAPLVVEHQSYGVLAFASHQPAPQLPQKAHTTMLQLMAQWIGAHLAQQQRMQALQWSNERLARFRATLDNLDDMIALADPRTLRFVDVNRGMVEATGLSLDELLTKRLSDLTTAEAQSSIAQTMNRLVKGQDRTLRFEVTLPQADGTALQADALVQWVELEEGKPVVVHLLRDATELKEAEGALRVSEERLKFALDGSNDGLWDWNINHDDLHCSPRLEAMLGFETGSLTGSMARLKAMILEQERPGVEALLRIHLDGHVDLYEAEYRITTASGRLMWILDRGKVVERNQQGQPLRAVGTFADITARKDMEAALHEAKVEAESASRAKSRFLANMSHEIRTPMNAILGLSSLALEQAKDQRQRDFLEKINHSGHFLMGLLNDILDLSKIEAERMDLEIHPFRLDELLKQLAANLMPTLRSKNLEVHFFIESGTPLALSGDGLRLGQVLHNLLSNAVKFTHEGEVRITIGAKPDQQQANLYFFTFQVQDSGIGIPSELQSKLFEPFIQADSSTTRQYGGTGLGLAICRRLMEMMNGHITLNSRPGEGSLFTCLLPIQAQSAMAVCCPAPEDAFKGLRLLIASRSPSLPDSIHFSMRAMEMKTEHVTEPEAMAQLLHSGFQPDVVLLDENCGSPENLLTAVQRIIQNSTPKKRPTILMTTLHQNHAFLEQLSHAGMDGLLDKPLLPTALYDALMRILHTGSLDMGGGEDISSRDHATHLAGLNILLVEDHELNMEVAKAILERVGIRVITAQHGEEALALVEQTKGEVLDAILMDLQMPIMDGFEATIKIRALDHCHQPPIIALTANAFSQDRERALKVGMNDHITKPISPKQLYEAISRWTEPKDQLLTHIDQLSTVGTQEDAILLPHLEDWQQQAVLERFEGNTTLILRLLDRLVEECQLLLPKVDALLKEQNWPEAMGVVHGFKGISGNLGLEALQRQALSLEQSLRAHAVDPQRAQQHWQTLSSSIQIFVESYSSWQNPHEVETMEPVDDRQPLAPKIREELLLLLAQRQMQARELYRLHQAAIAQWLGETRAEALHTAMEELDFATAEKVMISRA